jgi:aldehyde dehydrogenase (NAD+)
MYSSYEDKSDMTRIVTPAHAERLVKMIKEVEDAGCEIILGGSTLCNPSRRFITPTIVLNPPMTSSLMTEEVFGPVLPLITVR